MKPNHILLILALFVCVITKAQEKYEYATIEFNQFLKKEIQISINGKEYIEEMPDYAPNERAYHNVNPFLKKVSEYEAKGWEVMSFQALAIGSAAAPIHIAYLKKKKTEGK